MNSTIKIDGVIPIQIQNQTFEWVNIVLNNIPFMVTICVVLCSAIVTYCINKKSIDNQKNQFSKSRAADHENKISEFRHAWLQEVRNTASELIKSIHECQTHLMLTNLSRDYRNLRQAEKNEEAASMHQSEVATHYNKQIDVIANFYLHSAKIKLLFKNGDEQTKVLFNLLDNARDAMSDINVRSLDNSKIEAIICELQVILKNEWEETKKRTWREKN